MPLRPAALAAILTLWASPALGQASALAPSEKSIDKAQALYQAAELFYKDKEYDQALTNYKAAYQLSLAAPLLFNMAQCYRLLGQKEEAASAYRRFLEAEPETPY